MQLRVGVTRDTRAPDGSLVFAPVGLDALEEAGVGWEFLAEDARPLTPELLAPYDAVFHFSPPVTAASLEGVERLALLARHGVGLDMVDLGACTERGVLVTNTPECIRRPVASAAVALVLALAHRLAERNAAVHGRRWHEGRFLLGTGLTGRTLGVVGYGGIGREVRRLLAPWGMRALVATRTPPDDPSVEHVPLETLLEGADVVVVACPLTPETRGLLDGRRLALMKRTAFLVNVARGPIVDGAALARALREGRLAGAGLDVFDPEPPPPDDPLLGLPNVVAAPHALGYTDELFRDCVGAACASILTVLRGEVPGSVCNPAVLERPAFRAKLARYAEAARW